MDNPLSHMPVLSTYELLLPPLATTNGTGEAKRHASQHRYRHNLPLLVVGQTPLHRCLLVDKYGVFLAVFAPFSEPHGCSVDGI